MDGQQIRKVVLDIVGEYTTHSQYKPAMQQGSVLQEASERLGIRGPAHLPAQQALLAVWADLFREGYLVWGLDINNINPPFCHVTGRGRAFLQNLSHDPANPDGYLHYLTAHASLNPVARSYIEEGVRCYNNSCYKAAAVMIGCAAESVVLEVRDALQGQLTAIDKIANPPSKTHRDLDSRMIKTVLDAITTTVNSYKGSMNHALAESFAVNWPALAGNIRLMRNDVGHPKSVDPVSPESVHAAFLVFTFQAQLATNLIAWIPQGIV